VAAWIAQAWIVLEAVLILGLNTEAKVIIDWLLM
jgi:hypothetical protein